LPIALSIGVFFEMVAFLELDVTTARSIALHTHLPPLIFISADLDRTPERFPCPLRGGRTKARSLLHIFLYAAIVSITIYAVVDLDYPRSG
jgi:hypothetical protein